MLVEGELAKFLPDKDTLLTVGVFDGVHLGHKRLIAELQRQAREKSLLTGVVTFRKLPEELLTSHVRLPFLTEIETRIQLLRAEGVDIIVPLSFTPELAGLDASTFIRLLAEHLRMKGLVIGSDFALGRGREGDTGVLRRLGEETGFSVTIVPPLVINGEVVSSTALRKALADGDMKKYREYTGRSFSLRGKVVAGAGRGDGLGFPTANLNVSRGQALPPDGVYAGWAHINGNTYQAMTNIGECPTFGVNERTIESFLVDYRGDLYGVELTLDIVDRLRDERKFDNEDELKSQVAEDVRNGRVILESAGANQP